MLCWVTTVYVYVYLLISIYIGCGRLTLSSRGPQLYQTLGSNYVTLVYAIYIIFKHPAATRKTKYYLFSVYMQHFLYINKNCVFYYIYIYIYIYIYTHTHTLY
jgi:hypothetical protein